MFLYNAALGELLTRTTVTSKSLHAELLLATSATVHAAYTFACALQSN
jgi:hypothetical protein